MSSKSDEQAPDSFSTALKNLQLWHSKEINELQLKIAQQDELNKEQERQLTMMKKLIKDAKTKIKQQSKHIENLEALLKTAQSTSHLSVEQNPQPSFLPNNHQTPKLKSTTNFSRVADGFNKTGVCLFDSPTVLGTSTPTSRGHEQVYIVDTPTQLDTGAGILPVASQLTDLICSEIETEGVETQTCDDSDCTSGGDVSMGDDSEVLILEEDVSNKKTEEHSLSNSIDLDTHAPETCISLFGQSVIASHTEGRHLKLKSTKAKKIKYRETEMSTSASTSNSSSVSFEKKDNKSPSLLNETEFISSDLSPEINSPPFLGASPYKLQITSPEHKFGMSVSMFPASTTLDSEVDKTHTSIPIPIPQSDSQFSLDVSQSVPLSPELCGASSRISNMNNKLSRVQEECSISTNKKIENKPRLKDKQFFRTNTSPGVVMCKAGNGTVHPLIAIPKTPSVTHTTMVPVTPGVATVDKILSRPITWREAKQTTATLASNYDGTELKKSKGTKRQAIIENDEVFPARKKQHFTDLTQPETKYSERNLKETFQTFEGDPEYIYDSDFDGEESPVLDYKQRQTVQSNNHDRIASEMAIAENDQGMAAKQLAREAGLPEYKCVTKILKKADRDKLDAKACPECKAWFDTSDGIHDGNREHLKHTCRHKNLYLPPDTDPNMWNISFPDTLEWRRNPIAILSESYHDFDTKMTYECT